MHKYTQSELADSLESMIDDQGLEEILEKLAEICSLKAEHLEHCWGDSNSSWGWNKNQETILKAALAVRKLKY